MMLAHSTGREVMIGTKMYGWTRGARILIGAKMYGGGLGRASWCKRERISLFFLCETKMHTPPLHPRILLPVLAWPAACVPRCAPPPPAVHLAIGRDRLRRRRMQRHGIAPRWATWCLRRNGDGCRAVALTLAIVGRMELETWGVA